MSWILKHGERKGFDQGTVFGIRYTEPIDLDLPIRLNKEEMSAFISEARDLGFSAKYRGSRGYEIAVSKKGFFGTFRGCADIYQEPDTDFLSISPGIDVKSHFEVVDTLLRLTILGRKITELWESRDRLDPEKAKTLLEDITPLARHS
ncbi:MAG: hypothetical protein KGH57_01160 [Candidatus Micrarchaeota archaeon]|nr:hypothetical protein [Candidatus Micrarchaeota archaeon]